MPKPGELDSFQTSGGERREKERGGGSFGGGGGWDEEVMAADDGSDMEGWGEEDGWGDFEEKHPSSSKQKQKSLSPPQSSGADFFDTFQGNLSSNKSKERDYFSDFGVMAAPSSSSSSSSAKREKSPPPPVSASLFGSTGGGERKSESGSGGGSEGWGDWGSSNFGTTKPQVSCW